MVVFTAHIISDLKVEIASWKFRTKIVQTQIGSFVFGSLALADGLRPQRPCRVQSSSVNEFPMLKC